MDKKQKRFINENNVYRLVFQKPNDYPTIDFKTLLQIICHISNNRIYYIFCLWKFHDLKGEVTYMQHLWTSSRRENPISAEEDVWIRNFRIRGYG